MQRIDNVTSEQLNNRGVSHFNDRNYDAALADFTEIIELNPNFITAYANRGATYEQLDDHDAALADHTKAIELDSNCALAYANRGATYTNLGKYDAALADFTKAIELNPNCVLAYYNRGVIYYKVENSSAAILNFLKARKLDIKNVYDIDSKLNQIIVCLNVRSFLNSIKHLSADDAIYLLRNILDQNTELGKKMRERSLSLYNIFCMPPTEMYDQMEMYSELISRVEIKRTARLLYQGSRNRLTEEEKTALNTFRFFYSMPRDVCVLISAMCTTTGKLPKQEAYDIANRYCSRPANN